MSARFHFIQDTNEELKEAWFIGEDADTIEFKVQKAILRFVGDGSHNQNEIINFVTDKLGEFKVGRPAVLKGLKSLTDAKRLCIGEGPHNAKLYSKPTDEQLGLDKFTDIVQYNLEGKVE